MRNSRMKKVLTAVLATVLLMMLSTANAFAATTYIVKDGAFQNSGFINAGNLVDGTIQGPGNWTQLNLGDASVDAPYLHIIVKAEGGDTTAAQIAVSDITTFNLADLGVTLTGEFQDVVLPVSDNGIDMLSWTNFMGLDGGTVTYTIKDVFLSDDANPTIAAAVAPAEDTTTTDTAATDTAATDVPKTGENMTSIIIMICLAGFGVGYMVSKKLEKEC